jgi:hypothetical protein
MPNTLGGHRIGGAVIRPGVLVSLLLATAVVAGCSSPNTVREPPAVTEETTPPAASKAATVTPDHIRVALDASGVRVGTLEPPEFEPSDDTSLFGIDREHTVLEVEDGAYINFFDFESSDVASRAVSKVSPDGFSVPMGPDDGVAMVEWIGMPHFFISGDLVVLYAEKQVGDSAALDSAVIAVLRRQMGDAVAGNRLE